MTPPACRFPGCTTQCSVLSPRVQIRWDEREDVAWRREDARLAYFLFCTAHHVSLWQEDARTNNRHSRAGAVWSASPGSASLGGGVSRGVSGDFYLTSPPPDEPTERLEKKLKVYMSAVPPKLQKKVTWADGGQWAPLLEKRSFEQRERDLEEAVKLGLVTAAAPALDMERRHPFYRTGPCDGCTSLHVGDFPILPKLSRSVQHWRCGVLGKVRGDVTQGLRYPAPGFRRNHLLTQSYLRVCETMP